MYGRAISITIPPTIRGPLGFRPRNLPLLTTSRSTARTRSYCRFCVPLIALYASRGSSVPYSRKPWSNTLPCPRESSILTITEHLRFRLGIYAQKTSPLGLLHPIHVPQFPILTRSIVWVFWMPYRNSHGRSAPQRTFASRSRYLALDNPTVYV